MQAAVNVPVTQEAQIAALDGDVYKVNVNFETLVPGTYKLTAMVTDGNVNQATIAGNAAQIVGNVISCTVVLTEVTENVTLEVSSATQFTLGTYLLKLEWEPNDSKTTLNDLLETVRAEVQTTMDGHLTNDNKNGFSALLDAQAEIIEALESYKDYADNELWKVSDEEDVISLAIKQIQSDAEDQCIEDCWDAKVAAYNTAIADYPSGQRLATLQTNINALTDNKEKRLNRYGEISGKLTTFMSEANEALGSKDDYSSWEDAIGDVFDFDPDPSLASILQELEDLEGYVATDKANEDRYAAMTTRVEAAVAAIEGVDTDETNNLAARAINAQEKSDIQDGLTAYSEEASADYEQTIANDGEVFDYDPEEPNNEFPNLKVIEDGIEDLRAQIAADNQAYEALYTQITDYIDAARTYYNGKMTELAAAIPEPELQTVLEQAQTDLLARKTALEELATNYGNDFTGGEDLDYDVAKDAIDAITAEMDDVVAQAIVAANLEAFAQYKETKKNAADALAQSGDSEACQTLIATAKTNIDGTEYDETKTRDENKAVLDEIITNLETALAAQRDADQLAANQAEFADYKAEQIAAVEAMAQEGDSQDCQTLISNAKDAIEALNYDGTKTLVENKAAVDAIVTQLGTDLTVQRNHDAFASYQDEQITAVENMAETGDSEASTKLITDAKAAIEDLIYDETKTLDENKEAVDDIVSQLEEDLAAQRAIDNAEAAAGELVGYMYELVGTNQTTLLGKVNDSKDEVTGKMGIAEDDILPEYTTLIDAIEDIEEQRAAIHAAPIQPDVEGEDNLYNSNVKKVQAYNALLAQLGKTTDQLDAEGEGTLYAKYNDLKARADAAVAAKKANDDAYTALTAEVTALQNSLNAAKETIDGYSEWAQNQVAADETSIQTKIDNAQAALNTANNAQSLNASSTVDTKTEIESDIANLITNADNKQSIWQANEDKYNVLKDEFDAAVEGSLQAQLNEATAYINTNDPDVAASFAETLAGIQTMIDEAKTALETAHGNVTLTANSTIENKVAILAAIAEVKNAADKKQEKYTANNELMERYNQVNINLAEERSKVVAAAGDANDPVEKVAVDFYKNKFNGANGFAERLAGIKADIETKFNDATLEPNSYKSDLMNALNALDDEIKAVLAEATANKAAYDGQMTAYDNAVNTYDTNYTELTTNYEADLVQTEIAAMEAYSPEEGGELVGVKATIQNNYKIGNAVNVVDNVTTELTTIQTAIVGIMETLNGNGDSSYYQYICDYNDEVMAGVDDEIAAIMPAYRDAVRVLENYKSAQDPYLNAAITAAAATLNETVFGAVQQRTEFSTRAGEEQAAANTAKTKWDASALIAEIQDYVALLNDTKDDFTTSIKGEIESYWAGVKTNREGIITATYDALVDNGYIENENPEDIFETHYATIASGTAFVEVEGDIDIVALDNLVFEGALKAETFTEAVHITANSFAQNYVTPKIAVYTDNGGTKDTDWEEIEGIFGNHGLDYGKPANEDGIQKQFNDLVAATLTAATETDVTYATAYQEIAGLLQQYDAGVAALKATAQGWVATQEAADAALAAAQGALAAAQAELLTAVNAAQAAYNTLAGLVNSTSVAGKYADALSNIQALITTANGVATAAQPATLEAVQALQTEVAAQKGILTGAGVGTVIYESTAVEQGVIGDLKTNLKLLIPDLMTQFNTYAAQDGADQNKVDDWNARIQNAITLTDQNNPSTLEEMVNLEQDLALLQTEMGMLVGDMAATIEDFENRLAVLQDAALPEADYGNMTDEFNTRLGAIIAAADEIAELVAQHKEAGDIAPYVDIIKGRIQAQEQLWTELQEDAETQADKVATNKATVEALNSRVEVLLNAELTGEYSPADTEDFNDRLQDIKDEAEEIAEGIATNAAEIQNYKGAYETQLAVLEGDLALLLDDAADAAEAWSAQKDLSNGIYDGLSEIITEVENAINEARDAIDGFEYPNKIEQVGAVNYIESRFEEKVEAINEHKDDFTLNEESGSNYANNLDNLLGEVNDVLNYAARLQAQYLYTSDDCDLLTAQSDAWNAWRNWHFARNVRIEFRDALYEIDEDVEVLRSDINNDNDSYTKLNAYGDRAATIIAAYEAKKAAIEDYLKFGDANQDGRVNVADYQKVTNMILDPTLMPAEGSPLFTAIDINQNVRIEVGDLTAVVHYILDGDWQGYDEVALARGDKESESLTMATSMTQHGTQRIAVSLNNSGSYTAFQLDVVLPDGMTIVGQSLSNRAGQSHKLMSRKQMDGSIRLLASSVRGEIFQGNEGVVLYIDVETNGDYTSGEVQLMNVLFSEINTGMREFTVTSGEATGIDTVSTLESLKQQVYSLGGKLMNGLKKGVNIIRRADGTTQKVVK